MVPPPPGGTAAPEREAGTRPAPPPQAPALAGTAGRKRTRTNALGHYMGRAQRRQASTNRSGMGAAPSMTRTTPATPTLLPAQRRQRGGRRQSEPPPHWPPRPSKRGARRTGRPPPPPHPPAWVRPGRADPPHGGPATPSQVAGNGTGPPPPKHARLSKGPGQDARSGTDCVERAYQRPAPGPREVRAPHHPGEGGGGEWTPRERERTRTQRARGEYQKGNRTELAERTDRVEWRTSERG